jgi:hypothetical protein
MSMYERESLAAEAKLKAEQKKQKLPKCGKAMHRPQAFSSFSHQRQNSDRKDRLHPILSFARFRLDNTRIRYTLLGRANYVFSSFRSPELSQPF